MRKSIITFSNFVVYLKYFILHYFVKDYCQIISIFANWTFNSDPFQNHWFNYQKCLTDLCSHISALCPFKFLIFSNSNLYHQFTIWFETFAKAKNFQPFYFYYQPSFFAASCHNFKAMISFWKSLSYSQLLGFNSIWSKA